MNRLTSIDPCYRRPLAFCLLAVGAFNAMLPASARGDSVSAYSVFGGHSVTINETSNYPPGATGPIGSNGDVFLTGGAAFQAIRGGGSLLLSNTAFYPSPTVNGDITFDGNVLINSTSTNPPYPFYPASIAGNVSAGGDATVGASVGGTVIAGGNVTTSAFVSSNVTAGVNAYVGASVGGNLKANGDVTLYSPQPTGIMVSGNLNFGPGKFVSLGSGHVNGLITSTNVVAQPTPFGHLALPGIHQFASGGQDISFNTTGAHMLAPGSYGDLTMTSGFTSLNLSSGNYFFDAITLTGSTSINLDFSQGPINLFVTGAANFANSFFNTNSPSTNGQLYLESHDSIYVYGSSLGAPFTHRMEIFT